MDVMVKKEPIASQNTLRKGALRTSDAIAQSVALLSLVMGIALSTSYAAGAAGAAAPLAYIVAGLGSLCLAYIIIRFTRRIASAGGVYTYISQGLGPAVGFIGGWMYAGAFAIGISFTLAVSGAFLSALFANIHVTIDWFPIFCALIVVLFLFAFFDIRVSTRVQLVLAALGALAALILVGFILAKGGNNGLSLVPFSPSALPKGPSGLFFATIFSFTSFIGFESAAVLGEETSNPRYTIPRAILIAIVIGTIFYVIVTYAMSIGYGVMHAATWASDQAPLDTLANRYANTYLATFIDFMVAAGAFIASLAGLNLTARMLFAMGRDGGLPTIFSLTHSRYKSPWVGVLIALIITLLLGVTIGRSMGAFTFFGFLATTASLGVLLAYILVALSGMIFFLRPQKSSALSAKTAGVSESVAVAKIAKASESVAVAEMVEVSESEAVAETVEASESEAVAETVEKSEAEAETAKALERVAEVVARTAIALESVAEAVARTAIALESVAEAVAKTATATESVAEVVAKTVNASERVVETARVSKGRSVLVTICDIVLPIIAILLCGSTIYSTIIPTPQPPLNIAIYLVLGWLLLGLIVLGVLWLRDADRVRHFGKLLGE